MPCSLTPTYTIPQKISLAQIDLALTLFTYMNLQNKLIYKHFHTKQIYLQTEHFKTEQKMKYKL